MRNSSNRSGYSALAAKNWRIRGVCSGAALSLLGFKTVIHFNQQDKVYTGRAVETSVDNNYQLKSGRCSAELPRYSIFTSIWQLVELQHGNQGATQGVPDRYYCQGTPEFSQDLLVQWRHLHFLLYGANAIFFETVLTRFQTCLYACPDFRVLHDRMHEDRFDLFPHHTEYLIFGKRAKLDDVVVNIKQQAAAVGVLPMMGSPPLARTLQLGPIMGQEECHATAEEVQRRVQA